MALSHLFVAFQSRYGRLSARFLVPRAHWSRLLRPSRRTSTRPMGGRWPLPLQYGDPASSSHEFSKVLCGRQATCDGSPSAIYEIRQKRLKRQNKK